VDNNKNWRISNNKGGLSNISPTILKIMGIDKPKEMTSDSLIEEV
jgi:bisphosphoglycerate-independent phosphoglycerate mutase (AlkP superfamily)